MITRILQIGEQVTPIPYWEGYYITTFGRVISAKRKYTYTTYDGSKTTITKYRELSQYDVRGYKRVSLYKGKQRADLYVHDLVIQCFKGVADKKYYKVIHKNHDKLDNHINNLDYKLRKNHNTGGFAYEQIF